MLMYEKHQKNNRDVYLPRVGCVYLCLTRMYSNIIVNTTVVLRKVVYMGTFTPRTDSIEASFQRNQENMWTIFFLFFAPNEETGKLQQEKANINDWKKLLPCKANRLEKEVTCWSMPLLVPMFWNYQWGLQIHLYWKKWALSALVHKENSMKKSSAAETPMRIMKFLRSQKMQMCDQCLNTITTRYHVITFHLCNLR